MDEKRYPSHLYYNDIDTFCDTATFSIPDFQFDDIELEMKSNCWDETNLNFNLDTVKTPFAITVPKLIKKECCNKIVQHLQTIENNPLFIQHRNHGVDLINLPCMLIFANNFKQEIMSKLDLTYATYHNLRVKHIFALHYKNGESHPVHTDDSYISVNICLAYEGDNAEYPHSGGELEIWDPNSSSSSIKVIVDDKSRLAISPHPGSCTVHLGDCPHFAYPMVVYIVRKVNSSRYNIIIWYDEIEADISLVEAASVSMDSSSLVIFPQELFEYIYIHLSIQDLLTGVAAACKFLRSTVNSESLWEKILRRDFPGYHNSGKLYWDTKMHMWGLPRSWFSRNVRYLLTIYRSIMYCESDAVEKSRNENRIISDKVEIELLETEKTMVRGLAEGTDSITTIHSLIQENNLENAEGIDEFVECISHLKPISECHQAILKEMRFIMALPFFMHNWSRLRKIKLGRVVLK